MQERDTSLEAARRRIQTLEIELSQAQSSFRKLEVDVSRERARAQIGLDRAERRATADFKLLLRYAARMALRSLAALKSIIAPTFQVQLSQCSLNKNLLQS